MKPIEQWVKEDLPALKAIPREEMDTKEFFTDPTRPHFIQNEYLYAPADGTILYQVEVDPDEEIIEVKGKNFNLRSLLESPDFNQRCLVIGIFLTQWDVHITRMPSNGFLKYDRLEKLTTSNKPMRREELDIMQGFVDFSDMEYAFSNERILYTVYDNARGYKYYMVSIADAEVNVIANFYDSGKYLAQNCKFSGIRWGSQVDLILPMPLKYELLAKEFYHVEAGIDPLVMVNG